MNDPEFLIKCLIEYIESDITKAEEKEKKKFKYTPLTGKKKKEFDSKYQKDLEEGREIRSKRIRRSKRKVSSERLGDRRLRIFDNPAKKPKDTPKEQIDITGEEVFLTLNNKTALKELKTILNQPETKKYLSRLKQVAVKFPYDGLPMKGGKVDKNSTEYKKKLTDFLKTSGRNTRQKGGAGAKGMGATREVNTYLLEALNKLKDDSKDVKVKRNATNIIRLINNRNEQKVM